MKLTLKYYSLHMKDNEHVNHLVYRHIFDQLNYQDLILESEKEL